LVRVETDVMYNDALSWRSSCTCLSAIVVIILVMLLLFDQTSANRFGGLVQQGMFALQLACAASMADTRPASATATSRPAAAASTAAACMLR